MGMTPPPPPMPPASMVGHMPPVGLAPPPPPMIPSAPRATQPPGFAPPEHASPEVTQPHNPLQQLMYQHQQDAQSFLRSFLTNSQHQPSAPPPASASPLHLMTPIQPPPFQSRPMAPPLPQTMQLPLPPHSAPSSIPSMASFSRSTASQDSVPSTPRDGPPPGERIAGDHYEYRVGDGQQTTAQLEVTPVTIYTSQRRSVWGNMIAVNDQFISYPIRNGLIRLLGQSSADRLLLREHENQGIADIACFGGRSDLLLTAGTDGKIFVFRIATDPMSYEVLKVLRTPVQRAVWHPFDSNRIAVVSEGSVFITELNLVPGGAEDDEAPTDMQQYSVRCSQTASQIKDVVFSPCGRFLVTGGMDGFVHVYSLDGCAAGDSAELLHRFEPFDGGEVWSVRFYGGQGDAALGLLVGGDSNSKLSLWEDPLSEGGQPTCVQTVKVFHDDSESSSSEPVVYDVVFDPSAQFVFVTDRTRPLLFVLHLQASHASRVRRFDNITEFNVTHPVLSGSIINRATAREGSSESSFSMQFFTVQVHAIQRYNVASDRCYRPRAPDEDEDVELEETRRDSPGQSVGALTTEGESEATSFQAPAESPRATAAPETEVDLQTPQQNGDDESEYSSTQATAHLSSVSSPRRSFLSSVPHAAPSHIDTASLASEEAGGIARMYARSSPSSSVRAFRDDSSQLGEITADDNSANSSQILDYLRRFEANQIQREEQSRQDMQRMMNALAAQVSLQASAQVEKTIQKQIQTILVPAMGRIVLHTMENNFMKPVQAGFERAISERLIPEMEAKINASLESSLPEQMQSGVSDMVDRVVDEVRQPVRESFKECFRDIIIPSFQAATQKMFEQIHEHVLKGATASTVAGRQGAVDGEITAQLKQLTSLVDGLSRKVDRLQAGAANGHVPEEEPLTQEKRQQESLLMLLCARDYEEAFKFALGAQNIGLVAFACEQCEPRDVLSTRPPQLSQMIILCLVQQLGVDLSTNLPLKINWLQQALLVMNPRDPAIVGFVGTVLHETQVSLDQVPEAERDSQYTLLHHVLNSLISQVQ